MKIIPSHKRAFEAFALLLPAALPYREQQPFIPSTLYIAHHINGQQQQHPDHDGSRNNSETYAHVFVYHLSAHCVWSGLGFQSASQMLQII